MAETLRLEQSPPLTAIHEVAIRPRRMARPAGRAVASGTGAGRRGFAVVFVAGVAINVWALFPSGVESGVLIALPDVAKPAVADAESRATGGPRDPSRGAAFRLMKVDPVASHPMTRRSAPYPGVAVSVGTVPLRSKLQALLLLLSARYGDTMDAAALELKLQALLRLPDSVLAQLMQHPDLAGLNTLLDGMFLAAPDLSGVKTALDKITVSSTPGPTEQVDVVAVNGEPTYVVHSPLTERAPDGMAAVQLSAPAEAVTFSVAPSVDAFVPAPEPAAQIMVEFTTPPSDAPAEPSLFIEAPPQEPTGSTVSPVDLEVEDDPEPVEMDDEDTSAELHPDPSSEPSVASEPSADESADTPDPTRDPGGSAEDAADSGGDGTQGETSP